MTRDNQTWNGIGYLLRTNASYGSIPDSVGTLYRFETNIPVGLFNGNARQAFLAYTQATNLLYVSKVMDGVVDFRVHCYDTSREFLNSFSVVSNNFVDIQSNLVTPGRRGGAV